MNAIEERPLRSVYEETRQRLNELTILYEMTRISTGSLQLDQMLAEILEALNRFFRFEVFALLLMDENTRQWSIPPLCASLPGLSHDQEASWQDSGVARWVAKSGESLWVKKDPKDSMLSGGAGEVLPEIGVPIKAGKRILGILDVQGGRNHAFSEEDLRLLTVAGEQLGTIIENVRSEERYRAVVESALDGVMVVGADGRLIYGNERLAGFLGCAREELIGMDFRDFLEGEEREVFSSHTLAGAEGEEGDPGCEISLLRKDGEKKKVELSSTTMLDSQGNKSTVAFLKDLTEKRKMEEQLLQAEKLRAVGEMAGRVAHDFNNALTIILGSAQLLLLNPQDEESRDTLRTIERVAKGSSYTVRRLMDFTRKGVQKDSRAGEGTTFTLSFPARREGRGGSPPPSPVKKARKARVLVIDDEAPIRDVLLRILSKAEHQVALATSGEEGLRLFTENEFDLVLTDLGMPKMSGWEVCQAIKRTHPKTPVGMITGWGVKVEQTQIEANGVDFLIFKPFDFSNILEKVAEMVP